MKTVLNFKRACFLLIIIAAISFSAAHILHAAPSENSESNEERLEASKIESRLISIEKKIKSIQDNQAKLKTQQSEIKSDLDTLGVWIRRR